MPEGTADRAPRLAPCLQSQIRPRLPGTRSCSSAVSRFVIRGSWRAELVAGGYSQRTDPHSCKEDCRSTRTTMGMRCFNVHCGLRALEEYRICWLDRNPNQRLQLG